MDIVYPQNWKDQKKTIEKSFSNYLSIFINYNSCGRIIEKAPKEIFLIWWELLNGEKLLPQQAIFKLAMVHNSKEVITPLSDLNLLTKL